MKLLIGALAALAFAAPLSACGRMGELERPSPLNGPGRAVNTKATDAADARAQDSSRPLDTIDARDQATDPRPPRTLPIPSSGSDPFRQPPQGSLPNPYANPQ